MVVGRSRPAAVCFAVNLIFSNVSPMFSCVFAADFAFLIVCLEADPAFPSLAPMYFHKACAL